MCFLKTGSLEITGVNLWKYGGEIHLMALGFLFEGNILQLGSCNGLVISTFPTFNSKVFTKENNINRYKVKVFFTFTL